MLPVQSRAARVLLNWSLEQLAYKSGACTASCNRFESKGSGSEIMKQHLRRTFEDAGIRFVNDDGIGVISTNANRS